MYRLQHVVNVPYLITLMNISVGITIIKVNGLSISKNPKSPYACGTWSPTFQKCKRIY